ncbi:peptidoglycan DD-metalloendopeptidase family protein [Streptomyces sp. NPDC005879]|uniref:peptidoglycan DD-metalloendopeptidase family protein n=2 Tax=unclassified Streptomyces TaxID=2593676 RepID=UPI0033FB13B2
MNDRHPSGSSAPPPSAPGADYAHYATYGQQGAEHGGYGYDAYSTAGAGFDTGGYDTGGYDTGTFATDPLFGDMPGTGHDTGQWATATGPQQTLTHDAYAAQHCAATYDTGGYDTTSMWSTGGHQQLADIPSQPGPDTTAQWDAGAWNPAPQPGQWDTQAFETGTYDATTWNVAGDEPHESPEPETRRYEVTDPYEISPESAYGTDTDTSTATPYESNGTDAPYDATDGSATADLDSDSTSPATAGTATDSPTGPPSSRRASRGKGASGSGSSRTRRRSPAKRSALLTVAVPSVCVMGVAGVAAASVGSFGGDEGSKETTASAPDPTSVQPSAANNKLDTQLANLSADAGDFADRASRTQERIDLKAQKVAAQKKAAADAARKERLRPKFSLPVKQRGLSAYYGQAGVNWMSAHSGIDFPVSYGTQVSAATDGTVSTKWNSAYGNMAIVTAKDGTETWYCHLSSHKISSGPVKAGEVIAFSGNSGNSTGPHLHFEVRPGGGSAIDPLPWLRSHDLDPT